MNWDALTPIWLPSNDNGNPCKRFWKRILEAHCYEQFTTLYETFPWKQYDPCGDYPDNKVYGVDRTQVGPMLSPWTLLSGQACIRRYHKFLFMTFKRGSQSYRRWYSFSSNDDQNMLVKYQYMCRIIIYHTKRKVSYFEMENPADQSILRPIKCLGQKYESKTVPFC